MDDTTFTTDRIRRVGKAVASDLSLHWITYLGVLVVFASLLGLLLFSFADIPNEQQPFYELGMASVFFAFAWYLRRQGARYAARAMELVGGMTLPLVLYAGLVDDAPFPPDFSGGLLIGIMVAVALAISVVYRLIAQNNTGSMLGYLVAPLWWLAALVAGFVFKTDEPLTGDAITRLVTEQPALAALAIASTLLALGGNEWVRKPALVAGPTAYLLTLALAAGESWDPTAALLVAGLASLVSVEVTMRGTGAGSRLPAVRPFLAAAVIVPLLPRLETHLVGVVVFAVYLFVFELSARTSPTAGGLLWSRIGMAVGAALTWGDGWSAPAVFTVLTIWAFYRLRMADETTAGEYEAVAGLAPIGVGHALLLLLPSPDAFAAMAGVVVTVALTGMKIDLRLLRVWPTLASVPIAVGVVSISDTPLPLSGATTLVVVGAVVVLANRTAVWRFWFAAATFTLALGSRFEYFANPDRVATLTLASTGIVIVAGSLGSRDRLSVNVSYFGHLLTLGAGIIGGPGWAALAFGLLAIRGAVSARFTTGVARSLNQVVSVAAATIAWFFLLRRLDVGVDVAIESTALVWGSLALAVAVFGWLEKVDADWVRMVGLGALFVVGSATAAASFPFEPRAGIALPIGIALVAAAVEISWRQTHPLIRMGTPLLLAVAWLAGLRSLSVAYDTAVWSTALVAGVATVAVAELERRRRSHPGIMVSRLGVAVLMVGAAWMASLTVRSLEVGAPVSAAIAITGVGFGRLARPLRVPTLRIAASLFWVSAVLNLGWSAMWSDRQLAIVSAVTGAVAVLAYLLIWHRERDTTWGWPLIGVAVLADFVAVGLAMNLFPDPDVGMVVTFSMATQSLAAGTVLSSPGLLAVAPPAAAAGFLFAIGDTLTDHVSWWTVPLGLVGLAEIEILRSVRRRRGVDEDTAGSIATEAISGAVIVVPALASLFTDGLVFAVVGLATSVLGMVWAVVTRLRRRVYAAAGVALITAVLTLVAAAASTAPETVAFWVTGAGIGITVLLIAGYIEAYRNRRGLLVDRLDKLMEGWA